MVKTHTQYDYRWGVPLRTIDPAGNEMCFAYDYKGRLCKVIAPLELAHGKDYTIRYEYNLINHNLKTTPVYSYTHIYKDLYDSLFVQKEVALYDQYGRMLQRKHYAEVGGQDTWVVDKAERWDAFGRTIAQEYPFVAQKKPDEYEPINTTQAVVTTTYDACDRPLQVTNADGTVQNHIYHFATDLNNVVRLMTQSEDENHIKTRTLTSPQGWLIQQVAGDGSTTFFEYSPIGELLRTTDPEGYRTIYQYDKFGHITERTHPDAGKTTWRYDLAGNKIAQQTANLAQHNEEIKYTYHFNRLTEIQYPHHTENNVQYLYDQAGRIAVREDGTGSEMFVYDRLSNVAQSTRRIIMPTDGAAYIFRTQFKYDSFGRVRNIIYPDGEVVHYGYTTGGLLKSVAGLKQGQQNLYLWDIQYDELGRKIQQTTGNGVWSQYTYDTQRQWLSNLYTELPDGTTLQDLQYKYDKVGNMVTIGQAAAKNSYALGGAYTNDYAYDAQYRLVKSTGTGDFTYSFDAGYSPSGKMGNKTTKTSSWQADLLFGYDDHVVSHQPRTIFDAKFGDMSLFWDANGNLAQIIGCAQNMGRFHEWDEENQLRFVVGEKFAGYYGYDGNGERTYKLTGTSSIDQINSGYADAHVLFDNAVLYPNPYLVVTPKGYTKHYYAGTERLATTIGTGGFNDMEQPIDQKLSQRESDIISSFYAYYQNKDPFFYDGNLSELTENADINGKQHEEIDYHCEPVFLATLDLLTQKDVLLSSMAANEQVNGTEQDIFYYHGDHLGSAHWITDLNAAPIQYIHYAPYGELIENQNIAGYDERYKFTGKERDEESGYDYFGARFYSSALSFWLSVDPLAGKYPNISPYAYCGWDPIGNIDPDGCFTMENIYGNTHYKVILVLPTNKGTNQLKNTDKQVFKVTHTQACSQQMPTMLIDDANDYVCAMNTLADIGSFTDSYVLATSHGYHDKYSKGIKIGANYYNNKSGDFTTLKDGLAGKIVFITACSLTNEKTGIELIERFATETKSIVIGANYDIPGKLGFQGNNLSLSPIRNTIFGIFGGNFENSFTLTNGTKTYRIYNLTIDKNIGINWNNGNRGILSR